jgi:hypothetical protein
MTAKRMLRGALTALGLGVVIAVIAVLVVALVPGARIALLQAALHKANRTLLGSVQVEDVQWPRLSLLEVTGLSWVDGADTLLAADHILVDVRLRPLARREFRLRRAEILGLCLDLPLVRAKWGGPEPASAAEPARGSSAGSPHPGSWLPGLPVLSASALQLSSAWVHLNEGTTLRDIALSGAADFSRAGDAGQGPFVRVDSLRAGLPERELRLTAGSLRVDLQAERISGSFEGEWMGQPMRARLESPAERMVRLTVGGDIAAPGETPAPWGLDLALEFQPSLRRLGSLVFRGSLDLPGTRGLASLPALGPSLARVPELPRFTIRLAGQAHRQPTDRVTGRLVCDPVGWLQALSANVSYQNRCLRADSLVVEAAGLLAHGHLAWTPPEIEAGLHATAHGTRWLALVAPPVTPPDDIEFEADVTVSGAIRDPRAEARIEGRLLAGGLDIERVNVQAARDSGGTIRGAVTAQALGYGVACHAGIRSEHDLNVRLSPITIVKGQAPAFDLTGPLPATLTLGQDGLLEVRDLRVTGDLGDLGIDGTYAPVEGGRLRLAARFPAPPVPLLEKLDVDADSLTRLRSQWTADGLPGLELDARLTPQARQIDFTGTFLLPGPRALHSLLPRAARTDSLGPVRGRLSVSARRGTEPLQFDAGIEADADRWMPSLKLALQGTPDAVRVDSLRLVLDEIVIAGAGTVSRDSLDLIASGRVEQLDLILRLLGMDQDTFGARGELRATARGPRTAPGVSVDVEGEGYGFGHALRDVQAQAEWQGDLRHATLTAAGEIAGGILPVENVQARFESLDRGLLPGRIAFDARGADHHLGGSATLDHEGDWTVQADSLLLGSGGRDLRSQVPFEVRIDPARRQLTLRDLDLQGSLGLIQASGTVGPDSVRLSARARTHDIPRPGALDHRSIPWPDSVDMSIELGSAGGLTVNGRLAGLHAAGLARAAASIDLAVRDSLFSGEVALSDSGATLAQGSFRAPVRIRWAPFSLAFTPGPLRVDVLLRALPVLLNAGETIPSGSLDGRIEVTGSTQKPLMDAEATLAIDRPGEPTAGRLTLRATLSDSSQAGARTLEARCAWLHSDSTLLSGTARVPLHTSLAPMAVGLPADGALAVAVESKDLPLIHLEPFLPPGMQVRGSAQVVATAEGTPSNLNLNGTAMTRRIEATLPDGSRLMARGHVEVGGTSRKPTVRGAIEVEGGVIHVPERGRGIHPQYGLSLLRAAYAGSEASPDSSAPAAPPQAPGPSARGTALDLDVSVNIPGALWIRSRSFDVRLEGNLRVLQSDGRLTLVGKLEAMEGTLVFVGRHFTVERGDVVFYGGDELDPTLDLHMKTAIDQRTFHIAVSGKASAPKMSLSAEPEAMDEGEILSYLVFGQPPEKLQAGQTQLLGRMASAYASAELTARLSGLGLDMVAVTARSGDTKSSLSLGKYVTPRLLLRYEQSLESSADYVVRTEYMLLRTVRLASINGADRSGLEVRWTVEK